MLKALRIASIAAAISAIVVLAAVAFLGLQGDPEIESFLAKEGVVEQFRKKSQTAPAKTDAVSPLEQAAKAFALRIDPPPPPPPPKPVEPPKPVVKPPVAQPTPPRPPENKQPTMSAKFTLVATARYPDHPEKSMALLKNVQNEYKWYRQGEQVGHLEIHEIKDGSIVLYQGGKLNSELFMPAPPPTPSLLKSDASLASAPAGPSSVTASLESAGEQEEGPPAGSSSEGVGGRTIPSRLQTLRSRPAGSSSPRITSVQTSAPPPTVEMSPEEQLHSIDESISAIEGIMRQSEQEGKTEEERQAEQQAWQELLKVLAKEKEAMLQATGNQPTAEEAAAEKEGDPAPADKADSEGPETSEGSEKNP